jgi:hypothetical protein
VKLSCTVVHFSRADSITSEVEDMLERIRIALAVGS